MKGSTGNQ